MKSISTKLFLTLLGLTTVTLIVTIGLARWGFEYGFLDYRRSLEVERLENMSALMVAHYESNGGQWNDATGIAFDRLVRRSLPREQRPRDRHEGRPPPPRHDYQSQEFRPPSDQRDFRDRPPPRRKFERKQNGHSDKGLKREPPLHRPPEQRSLPQRPKYKTALFDMSGLQIAGHLVISKKADLVSIPLFLNGSQIGELRASVVALAISREEKAFARQQTWASVIIAVLALFLAIIASWLLSRTLLNPIIRLKNAIESLAKGDFSVELSTKREDELGALMTDINSLSATLQANRSSRQRWLADISHELRTPVTILAGEVEAMKDGVRSIDLQGIDSLAHEIDRLKHLIDDLYQLSLSDVGGLSYAFRGIDLTENLNSTVQPFLSRAQARGLKLSIKSNGSHIVSGDQIRLEQLFRNVLNNSISYTDSPGRIELSISRQADKIVINIDDSAPTVVTNDFEVLFEPLYREEGSRNRRSGGAGLGLTICKNIVEAHNGQITAERSPLGGVRIQITLPAS